MASIDSFFVHDNCLWLIQDTVSQTHPVLGWGLAKCIEHVGTEAVDITEIRLGFVVPSDALSQFKLQKIKETEKHKYDSKILTNMRQYVIGIKLVHGVSA